MPFHVVITTRIHFFNKNIQFFTTISLNRLNLVLILFKIFRYRVFFKPIN